MPLRIAHGSTAPHALHREEASVLAAAREAPDEVEEKLGQLRTRLAVAENSLFADVSDEWTTFAAAVEDELRSWDTYLERLQATAAAKAGNPRESGPRRPLPTSAPSGSRSTTASRRHADVNGAWHEQRNHVSAARDELERKAAARAARPTARDGEARSAGLGGERNADDRPGSG